MANVKWIDRIGETKEVEGFVFTLFDVDGKKVIVEVNDDLHEVTRDVWRRGVFSKIIKLLKPTQTKKVINGILFTVIEAAKRRVKVIAEGFDGIVEMGKDTFKKGKFFKRVMKHNFVTKCRDLVLGKKAQHEKDKEEYLKRDDLDAFHGCETVAETKRVYKRLAKKYHPDHGGTQEQFRLLQVKYEIHLAVVETLEKVLAEEGLAL